MNLDSNNQYYVRLRKIGFKNFRNIENSSVEIPNSSMKDYLDESPSILGLYGQNGSGKSSVIMALGILKTLLSGGQLDKGYSSCVQEGHERCTLNFEFSIFSKLYDEETVLGQSIEDSYCYNVSYEFDIKRASEPLLDKSYDTPYKPISVLVVENEVLKYRITSPDNKKVYMHKQVFIDTKSFQTKKKKILFGSDFKERIYTAFNPSIALKYRDNLATAATTSRSFIFSPNTLNLIQDSLQEVFWNDPSISAVLDDMNSKILQAESMSEIDSYLDIPFEEAWQNGMFWYKMYGDTLTPYRIVRSLFNYGLVYLHVIDTATTGVTNINRHLPLHLWTNEDGKIAFSQFMLNLDGPTNVPENALEYIKRALTGVGNVLEKIVPGMKLGFIDYGVESFDSKSAEHLFELTSIRDGVTIPLQYESDGIRRIVSILSLLIAVYNDKSFTIAIDELDSGIFEYLLGELLAIMGDSIKGQLVFTSHNLRPLEVLPSKFIYFTTTNQKNRFIKIPNRGNSNLRDNYYRSIILNTQKESVYAPTDRYDIELALYRAGRGQDE